MPHKKGSKAAMLAGKRASITRARNKRLKKAHPQDKEKPIIFKKIGFRPPVLGDYTRLTVNGPCKIYIHNQAGVLYIKPDEIELSRHALRTQT